MGHNKRKRSVEDTENKLCKELKRMKREMKKQKKEIRRLKRHRPESSQSESESSTQDQSLRRPLIPLDNLLSGSGGSQREHSAPEREAEGFEVQPAPEEELEVVEKQPVPDVVEVVAQEPEVQALDPEVLKALGKRVDSVRPLAPPMHNDIMLRWGDILKEGLPEEERKELQTKYPTLENCTTMEPPKLNAEIKATVLEPIITRDNKIVEKQRKVSICLAAMGPLLSNLLKGDMPDRLALISTLSDVCRLLVDLQRDESRTRRLLILSKLNASLKESLNATVLDEWLFGKDLDQTLKAAKLLERSSKDLKLVAKSFSSNKGTKNSKGPSRPSNYYRGTRGGQRKSDFQSRFQKRGSDQKDSSARKPTPNKDQSFATKK